MFLHSTQHFVPFNHILQVGSTTMSSQDALKAGLRGKALRITHYYRDSLWQVEQLGD